MSKADLSRLPAVDKTLKELEDIDLPRPIVLSVIRKSIEDLRDRKSVV